MGVGDVRVHVLEAGGKAEQEDQLGAGEAEPMEVDSDEPEESEDEDNDEEDFKKLEEAMSKLKSFSYEAVGQGDSVCVGNEEDFYHIGIVEDIISPSLATVNFFEHCSIKGNAYKWRTGKPDRAQVLSQFVISTDLTMTSNSNGRMWTLQDSDFLELLYMEFRRVYFD